MKLYETVFIVDPQIGDDGIERCVKKFFDYVEERASEVVRKRKWGLRKLAYQIRKRDQGYYVLINYVADGDLVRDLERELKLDESILRYMTVVVPKREMEKLRADEASEAGPKAAGGPGSQEESG